MFKKMLFNLKKFFINIKNDLLLQRMNARIVALLALTSVIVRIL